MIKKSASKEVAVAPAAPSPSSAVSIQTQAQAVAFMPTPENVELLKSSLSAAGTNLTDNELGLFLYQAQKTGLDPLARQIYVMKRGQGGVTFMTSIDGQRLVAQRTREYDGQTPPQWCGSDGVWREVWLENGDPAAARVGVYRQGMREPVYGIATWKSYNQGKGQWAKMGDVMLAKCAEALALRKAFPQELSGLYTAEEIDQNGPDAPAPPRAMTTTEALAEAGRTLVEKGFSREEALEIMTSIADVDDASKLNGNNLVSVLEIVHREDAESLSLYIATGPDDDEDPAMPPDFLQPQEAVIVDDEPAKPKYEVPDYKKGSSSLARPEMVKQFNAWALQYGLSKKADLERFCQNAFGKPAPQTFDDYKAGLDVLADELNSQAEQGTLV